MFECVLCRFPTEIDDIVVGTAHGRCVCLRCYERETASGLVMTPHLRQAIEAVMAAASPT